ncbi:MAG: dinitrogenase iron-molybdenum cofactor biosynthesis protein [Spongiibacteraceae bacterium]
MSAPLSDDIALRIGLAARALELSEPRPLLRALIDIMGEPITATKLSRLRAQRLRNAVDGLSENIQASSLQRALSLLKGQGIKPAQEPMPIVESVRDDEMGESLLIACTSNSRERIDGHFGSCPRFLIYRVSRDRIALVDVREPGTPPPDTDRNAFRAELISDCNVLYTVSIGGPACAKVIRAGLHPIKLPEAVSAREEIGRLQQVLRRDAPPPWLQKAMGTTPKVREYS